MLYATWPPLRPEQPAPTAPASNTHVAAPAAAVSRAADNPVYPAPTIKTSTRAGSGRRGNSGTAQCSCQYGFVTVSMSVMRRPLIVGRSLALFRLGGSEALRHLLDARSQRANFQLLAKNHIAEIGVCLFQERDLGLNLLQRLLGHRSSIAHVAASFPPQVPQNVCNTRSSGSGGAA